MNAIITHKLWLIYSQLKDAENDPVQRLEILERSRAELGDVLNEIHSCSKHQPEYTCGETQND